MIPGEHGEGTIPGQRRVRVAQPDPTAELRQMALHLETASLLELRARRSTDPAQAATLCRRAQQRRAEAARIRQRLAARGAAVPAPSRSA